MSIDRGFCKTRLMWRIYFTRRGVRGVGATIAGMTRVVGTNIYARNEYYATRFDYATVGQLGQSLTEMLAALPRACGRGTKCNAQGYKISWNGDKQHIDTVDCGVVVSALLTSASVHDSQTAVPLALITQSRVTSSYDLMDLMFGLLALTAD